MTRRRTLALLVLACAIAAVVASAVHASRVGVRAASLRELAGVNFVSGCGFSHRAPDDPIVFPGQPGRSHDHTFVGNESTNAFSTLASLRSAATTCRRAGDTAGYWAPTLLVDSQPVPPARATIYYRRTTLAAPQAFPTGLKIVAGDLRAIDTQDTRVVFWS